MDRTRPKPLVIFSLLALGALMPLLAPGALRAQAPLEKEGPAETTEASAPVYKPPLRGAPGGRVGGASRSAVRVAAPLPTIELLAPADHAGQTTSAAPTLYFFASQAVAWPMQLTISAPLQPAPVLEVTIPSAPAPGIYGLRLADYRVRLEPGIVYTWSVSIVLEPRAWSRNIVASAAILRNPSEPAVERAMPATARTRQPGLLAQAGLWYDAVASAAELQELDRHAALDRLLEQVGLVELARNDRLRASGTR